MNQNHTLMRLTIIWDQIGHYLAFAIVRSYIWVMRFDDRERITSHLILLIFNPITKYHTYIYVDDHIGHIGSEFHVTLDRSFPSSIVLSQAGSIRWTATQNKEMVNDQHTLNAVVSSIISEIWMFQFNRCLFGESTARKKREMFKARLDQLEIG